MSPNNKEFITILLPTYNSAEYISEAILSILNQTFKNFELLIVDDGSIDNTEQIVKEYTDERINYKKKEHTGLASTLNYGLAIAKYEWVARMDADDISHPMRIEKQMKIIEQNSSQNLIVFTKVSYFQKSKILFNYFIPNKIQKIHFVLHSPIPHSTVIYNRNYILSQNGYNEDLLLAEDFELWLRILDKVIFQTVNEILVYIRFDGESMSRKDTIKTNSTIYDILEKYHTNFNSYFGTMDKKKEIAYLGWLEYFYGSPKKARKLWFKHKNNLLNIRVMIAFCLSFLPKEKIIQINEKQIKLKLLYTFKKILGLNRVNENEFFKLRRALEKDR